MDINQIRESLNYYTYIEHAHSIKLAADENNRMLYGIANEIMTEENRLKGLGLIRASLMLYAISIELTLKAVVLFQERKNIISGNIKTFDDFLNKIRAKKGSGHDFSQIIELYKIKLIESDLEIINHLQDYTIWAGRFPFPRKEKEKAGLKRLLKRNHSTTLPMPLSHFNNS